MSITTQEEAVTRLEVSGPEGSYPIHIGRGLFAQIGAIAAECGLGRKAVVATDEQVAALYGEGVASSLRAAGFDVDMAVMPAGEANKTWASVSSFVEAFARAGLARDGWVLALGGGVVGDTAGFAASIYMRGVALAQVPTTLLAMADSSVGGKVGVDHETGKNMLGAFKQPRFVLADTATLATLSPLQISCGIAEVIKAGIIGDPDLFRYFEGAARHPFDFQTAIVRAIMLKRDIVQRDPFEEGERAHLNLGHTFGHAFEQCTGYARPHGVAVAQGMVVAAHLAARLGMCDPALADRLRGVLYKWDLPSTWGHPDLMSEGAAGRVYDAMKGDKKRREGAMRLVLPEAIGRVVIVREVPASLVVEALEETR
jgi:3-dehydroquinate synthase